MLRNAQHFVHQQLACCIYQELVVDNLCHNFHGENMNTATILANCDAVVIICSICHVHVLCYQVKPHPFILYSNK